MTEFDRACRDCKQDPCCARVHADHVNAYVSLGAREGITIQENGSWVTNLNLWKQNIDTIQHGVTIVDTLTTVNKEIKVRTPKRPLCQF